MSSPTLISGLPQPDLRAISAPPFSQSPDGKDLTPERIKTLIRPLPPSPSRLLYPKERYSWFDDTQRMLMNLGQYNKKEPLSFAQIFLIDNIVDRLIAQQNSVELLTLLKLLSDPNCIMSESKRCFFKVLKTLREIKPEINDLFKDISTDDPTEGPSLTPLAINLMFDFYQQNYGFPSGILSYEQLSALPDLVNQMVSAKPGTISGWMVADDDNEYYPHIVPVFVINHNNQTHLFIFDSLGHNISRDSHEFYISQCLEKLCDQFRERADLRDRLTVYSYKIKRQNSEVGCATFSLLDLKNLCERHFDGKQNIVDFYTSQASEYQPRRINEAANLLTPFPIYEIQTLPPEMMKVTQSFRKIENYRLTPPILEAIPEFYRQTFTGEPNRKRQDMRALEQSVSDLERIDAQGSSVNLYIEQKRFADIVYLISSHFNGVVNPRVNRAAGLGQRLFQ